MERKVSLTFINPKGKSCIVEAEIGQTLLSIAQDNDLDLEGTCEGNMACSTCHIILNHDDYAKLAPASEDEEEMLELAVGLTVTSRLGCQVIVEEYMDGMQIHLPQSTRNMMGF